MDLLKIEKTINQKCFIGLARDLTLDDVNAIDYAHFPVSSNDAAGRTYKGVSLALKPEIISQFIELTGININDSGKFINNNGALGRITDEWDSTKPSRFDAIVEEPLRYNGRGSASSKQEHLDNKISIVKSRWEDEKDSKLGFALKGIQKTIERFLTTNTENVQDMLRNVVVEQGVSEKWFDNNLNDADAKDVTANNSEIEKHKAEITKLRTAIEAKQNQNYRTKRACLEKKIMSDPTIGEQTKAALASFADEEKTEEISIFGY